MIKRSVRKTVEEHGSKDSKKTMRTTNQRYKGAATAGGALKGASDVSPQNKSTYPNIDLKEDKTPRV